MCNGSAGEARHAKAFHYCSGHWRKSDSVFAQNVDGEMKVWIKGHWRGDPSRGIVLKKYAAKHLASHVGS